MALSLFSFKFYWIISDLTRINEIKKTRKKCSLWALDIAYEEQSKSSFSLYFFDKGMYF